MYPVHLVRQWHGQSEGETSTKQNKFKRGHQIENRPPKEIALALQDEAVGPGLVQHLGAYREGGDQRAEARLFTEMPNERMRKSGIS